MIVETYDEYQLFENYWISQPSIVVPIWCDHELHPMMNKISFIYVRFLNDDFIIPFDHNDCVPIKVTLSNSDQRKFVWNKKGLIQTKLGIKNMFDIQEHKYFTTNELYSLDDKLEPLRNFYTRNGLSVDLGKTIPIMKYLEALRSYSSPLVESLRTISSISDTWINNTMIPILSLIEQTGIHVAQEKFFQRFPNQAKFLEADKIYTEYNPYTPTSRPSNRHGGINFGALNKSDGTRECFVPSKNNVFLQFDYDAYHVRIIARMIGYEIPHKHGHQWLANMYGCEYDESKGRTFRIIYGGVSEEDRKIPFFAKLDDYIQEMWKNIERDGYVETPKGRKIYLKWVDSPNPQKMFNYLLQATETELNMEIIKKLYESGHTNLVLYQYDSFLFDFEQSTQTVGMEKFHSIKKILESYEFPVKHTYGTDYSKV